MLYLLTKYVYYVYTAMSKSPKQLPNCRKRAETIVVLITFDGVHESAHILLPYLTIATHESGTRKTLLCPGLNNTEVYLTPVILHFISKITVILLHQA
jgi:hypothetical protein